MWYHMTKAKWQCLPITVVLCMKIICYLFMSIILVILCLYMNRQSIATNWPPTLHPLTGKIRYMPYNSANMPTVLYIMGVGSPLLPQPIRGAPALSEVSTRNTIRIVGWFCISDRCPYNTNSYYCYNFICYISTK